MGIHKIASPGPAPGSILTRTLRELPPTWLHALLQLRSDVFIVEQNCAYADIDGRDADPSTLHLLCFVPDESGSASDTLVAYLRILDHGQSRALGRVVTSPNHRSQGYATRLMQYALHHSRGPWTLNAQAQLESWYGRFGFERCGPNFDEDGIDHVPMNRAG